MPRERLPSADLDILCASIAEGSTVPEAAREIRQKPDTIRSWIEGGQNPEADPWLIEFRARVIAAQSVYRHAALEIIGKAAASGAPRAMEEVLRRVGANNDEAARETPPEDPDERAAWRLKQIEQWVYEEKGIARTRLLDHEATLLRQIDSKRRGKELTHEEQIEALKAELHDWPDAAIRLVMAEARTRGLS